MKSLVEAHTSSFATLIVGASVSDLAIFQLLFYDYLLAMFIHRNFIHFAVLLIFLDFF